MLPKNCFKIEDCFGRQRMHSTLYPAEKERVLLQGVKICISMYLYISKAPGEVFLTFREGANSAVTFLLYLFLVTTHPFPKGLFMLYVSYLSHLIPCRHLWQIVSATKDTGRYSIVFRGNYDAQGLFCCLCAPLPPRGWYCLGMGERFMNIGEIYDPSDKWDP